MYLLAANKLIFKNAEIARDSITASQKKQIQKLYSDWADDISKKARSLSHKDTYSSGVASRQMRELENQLRQTGQQMSNKLYSTIKNNILLVSDEVIKCNNEWLASLGFSEKGIEAAFSYVPNDIVSKLITGQIYESGWSLSKSIWGDNEKTLKDIYSIVAKGMAENKPIYEIAKDLEKYVNPSKRLPWNLTAKDGVKIFKKSVDYNAQRLARTLVQHGYQQSFVEATQKNPFITSYIWEANGSRVCPICQDRDGQKFAKDELPLDHPNGMCTMVPDIDDNFIDGLANWFNSPVGTYPDIDDFANSLGFENF